MLHEDAAGRSVDTVPNWLCQRWSTYAEVWSREVGLLWPTFPKSIEELENATPTYCVGESGTFVAVIPDTES